MDTSAAWINDYLDPPASAEEQGELLTRAGFPLEGSESVAISAGTDTRQDFEMTSNRGDCVCHHGLAREIAALSGRTLKSPSASPKATGPSADSIVKVINHEPELCPLYTARVIRGVKVGPSPAWLADRLIARGDIPRNNLVDLTNFILFELGQPMHVFDLAKLKGPEINIRRALPGEPIVPLGEGAAEVKLTSDDLVIADAEDAIAIAGVKGGAPTAVTNETTDILIESATFAPVTVRNTSRRLNIGSDSSYRYERGVHPAQVNPAADRLAALILEVCGGELCEGVVSDGQPIPQPRTVSMRTERCRALLGVAIEDATMVEALSRLGFQPKLKQSADGSVITCTVPIHRLDIEREVDLIEEVSRMYGHDNIPIAESLHVRVAPPQSTVLAKRAVSDALVGMGYLETVTHTLVSEKAAATFLPPGMSMQRVDDDRAKAEPVLRPSVVPSLLRVLALNRDNSVADVKLFESAATFASTGSEHHERVNLAIVLPAPKPEQALRELRGVIDRLVQIVLGDDATVQVQAHNTLPWFAHGAVVKLNGEVLGNFGQLTNDATASFGIDEPVLAAEIGLPALYEQYPPETEVHPLPSYPAIERDVSAIVEEHVTWSDMHACVAELKLDAIEAIEFVTAFRGKPIEKGRKSITVRLRFRAGDRTLKHADVDPQMKTVVDTLQQTFSATMRTA